MKKSLPWILVAIMAVWALASLRPPHGAGFDTVEFSQLPILLNGRIQPFDSMARNSLLQMRNKQSVYLPAEKKTLTAAQWLVELMMDPARADTRPVFRTDNPELLSLLKLPEDEKYFSFDQLRENVEEMGRQSERISGVEGARRTPFEKQVMKLEGALLLYQRLKVTLAPPESQDFAAELAEFQQNSGPGLAALKAQESGVKFDAAAMQSLLKYFKGFSEMAQYASALVVPPQLPQMSRDHWESAGTNLMQTVHGAQLSPAVLAYAKMVSAYRRNDPAAFNTTLTDYAHSLRAQFAPEVAKGRREFLYNQFQAFYRALVIYLLALVLSLLALVCFSLPSWSEMLRRAAYYLVALACLIHTAGLLYRMILEGRPPVTNLYSSAIFIGWGAVLLGLVLERLFRLGIGNLVGSSIGFVTLIIAHNLAVTGDTMEMMRAVLDSNFWLATHVVTVSMGYFATFVAGTIALIYILMGVTTPILTKELGQTLGKMVYGIVCFATLFSFVGTVLGGIWADQSWGRFWGWDPKENGALMIVLWNAAILHARWGGWIRERGLMNMAIFGNIITAFSWFGVNMLGIGLHSYGFMDSAFNWLMLFVSSQVLLMGLGMMPTKYWKSFQVRAAGTAAPDAKGPGTPAPVGT
jgi:ABC-type transport system involved in cytochrome c biogenesis permease subunit